MELEAGARALVDSEVAEHIVLAEASLFGNLKKALSSPGNPEWEERTKGKTRSSRPSWRRVSEKQPLPNRLF